MKDTSYAIAHSFVNPAITRFSGNPVTRTMICRLNMFYYHSFVHSLVTDAGKLCDFPQRMQTDDPRR